jgi:hypothetical protein
MSTHKKEEKKYHRFFPVWKEKKEQYWLETMAKEGWHLKAVSLLSYRFEKGESRDMIYRFDFKPYSDRDLDEYLGIFQDAGWEHVDRLGSWHYFRKIRGEDMENEIYTDYPSLHKKYRNLLGILFLFTFPAWFTYFFSTLRRLPPTGFFSTFLVVLSTVIMVVFGYSTIRILLYLKSLKEKH